MSVCVIVLTIHQYAFVLFLDIQTFYSAFFARFAIAASIKRADVKNCILCGEIIEDYPDDFSNPSCLVFGMTLENKALHVVAGTDGNYLYIITAYFPTEEKFESDLKTRRK